jgi:hypothetical protein
VRRLGGGRDVVERGEGRAGLGLLDGGGQLGAARVHEPLYIEGRVRMGPLVGVGGEDRRARGRCGGCAEGGGAAWARRAAGAAPLRGSFLVGRTVRGGRRQNISAGDRQRAASAAGWRRASTSAHRRPDRVLIGRGPMEVDHTSPEQGARGLAMSSSWLRRARRSAPGRAVVGARPVPGLASRRCMVVRVVSDCGRSMALRLDPRRQATP